ncbi:MAG: Galactose/methyl galactoside import ATP-binding protein MglA [bacterium]|nr:Galactose/methyl galactoside import ATP-binding protein MglA [bacterium]
MMVDKRHAFSGVREIRLQGIQKHFGPISALAGVDLTLKAGEVQALLGENGAGKSTLMKILFGLYRPDAGAIYFDHQPAKINSSADAMQLGLGFVQQHFSLVEGLTVAENIVLGKLPSRFYEPRSLQQQVQNFINTNGFALDAAAPVRELSVGERQRVEIIKALYRQANFIIFDEPTSVLAPLEVETLFATIRQLQANGKGIIFITHKLDEVLQISNRITILRGGKNVATLETSAATAENLARLMIGEIAPPIAAVNHANKSKSAVVLQVANLQVRHERRHVTVHDISFELHAGEILGVAGVDGSGQRELAETIMGLRAPNAGTIVWNFHRDKAQSRLHRQRIGFVPPDRLTDAFVPEFSVAENLLLESSDNAQFRRAGFLAAAKVKRHAEKLIEDFNVVCKGPQQKLRELSGGNQQKLLLGRALGANPTALVAMNPTWGVDVAATAAIHQRLFDLRQRGGAVLLFSTDLDEIYALCDRFLVLHAGRVMGWATAATSTTQVGLWMTGRMSATTD